MKQKSRERGFLCSAWILKVLTTLIVLVCISNTTKAQLEGQAVATNFPGMTNGVISDDYVVKLIDIHSPPYTGSNWPASMQGYNWKSSMLGQVFGIAIDKRNLIYVTATSVYTQGYRYSYTQMDPLAFGPGGPGGVYILDPNNLGLIENMVYSRPFNSSVGSVTNMLPNGNGVVGPSLGNICYDGKHDKLYLTNMEDGKIYKIDPLFWDVEELYDPVTPANSGGTTNPAMTLDSGQPGMPPLGDRPWGIGYNHEENRIYYGVWVKDYRHYYNSTYFTRKNVVRSVALDLSGNVIPGSDKLEIIVPDYIDGIISAPVSDIAFSFSSSCGESRMSIAGRCMKGDYVTFPHLSKVLQYRGGSVSGWNPEVDFIVGQHTSRHANASGGVDYGYTDFNEQTFENSGCEDRVWYTGDALLQNTGEPWVYGLQSSPADGNTASDYKTVGHFINLNVLGGGASKTQIGDIEVFRNNCGKECLYSNLTANAGLDKTICEGESTVLGGELTWFPNFGTSTATGGTKPYNYLWNPDNGLSCKTCSNPLASPSQTTTYMLTVTDANGCTAVDEVVVTVIGKGEDVAICKGETVTIGPDVDPIGTNYSWSDQNGGQYITQGQLTVSPSQTTTYYWTVTIGNKTCNGQVIVTVRPNPKVNAGVDRTICKGQCTELGSYPTAWGGSPGYTYEWTYPILQTIPGSPSNPIVCPNISTSYKIKVTDVYGCKATDKVKVKVVQGPTANAGDDKVICEGECIRIGGGSVFIGNSGTASGGSAPYTYDWSLVYGSFAQFISNQPNPIVCPTETTTYQVFVTDKNGCTDIDEVTLYVLPRPEDKIICMGESVEIGLGKEPLPIPIPTIEINPVGYTYSWSEGNTKLSTVGNIWVSPTETTTYRYCIAWGKKVCCYDVTVTVNPSPAADAGDDITICEGQCVKIGGNPSASGGTPGYAYSWQTIPTSVPVWNSGQTNPEVCPKTTTLYELTVIDTNGCSDKDTVIVTVVPSPIVDAGPDKMTCKDIAVRIGGSPTVINGGTGNYILAWYVCGSGNPSFSNALNPTVNPSVTTNYCLKIKDNETGCSSSDEVIVVVDEIIADAGADKMICHNGTTQLGGVNTGAGGSGNYSYTWIVTPNPPEVNPLPVANPTVSPSQDASYDLTVTDIESGCVGTDNVKVLVNSELIVDAGQDATICDSQETTIGGEPTARGGSISYVYEWYTHPKNIGDVPFSTIDNPVVEPNVSTTYCVFVTDASGCQGMDTITITVFPSPIADAGEDLSICKGFPVSIGGLPTAQSGSGDYYYNWFICDGSGSFSSSVSNPTINPVPTSSTTYCVEVRDNASGCIVTDSVHVDVNDLTVDVGEDQVVCEGTIVNIGGEPTARGGKPSNGINPYTYSWTKDGQAILFASSSITFVAENSGTYCVTVTDEQGCSETDCMELIVHPTPVVNAGEDKTICDGTCLYLGSELDLVGGTPNYTFHWQSLNNSWTSIEENPEICPTQTDEFVITVTDVNGCQSIDSLIITVNPTPQVDAGNDRVSCHDEPIVLNAVVTGGMPNYVFAWYKKVGTDPAEYLGNSQMTIDNDPATGTSLYWVDVWDENGCYATDYVTITVNTSLIVDAGMPESICQGDTIILGGEPTAQGGSGNYVYQWVPLNSGLNCYTCPNPEAVPNGAPNTITIYRVTVTDVNGGCQASDEVGITINPKPEIVLSSFEEICNGDSVQLNSNAPNTYDTYSWTPNRYLTCSDCKYPKAFPPNDEEYCLVVTNSYGCSNVSEPACVMVYVNPLPIANAGPDLSVCKYKSVEIGGEQTAQGGTPFVSPPAASAYNYSWTNSNGSTVFGNNANPSFTGINSNVYTVVVSDSKGCTDTDAMNLNVAPDIEYIPNNGFELGLTPTLRGQLNSKHTDYTWFNAAGDPDLFDKQYGVCGDPDPVTNQCTAAQGDVNCVGIPCNHFGNQTHSSCPTCDNGRYAGLYSSSFIETADLIAGPTFYEHIENITEGIEVKLSTPLVVGQEYCIDLIGSLAENGEAGNLTTDQEAYYVVKLSIGAAYSGTSIVIQGNAVRPFSPTNAPVFHSGKFTNKSNWKPVNFTVVADKAYTHIIVESAVSDNLLEKFQELEASLPGTGGIKPFVGFQSYFYIDDISMSAIECCNANLNMQMHNSVNNDESSLLDNVISHEFSDNVKIYPNPTSGELNIQLNTGSEEPAYVQVYSLDAKLVSERQVVNTTNNGITTMNLSHLPQGIYYVELVQGEQVIRERIVVQ